MEFKAYNRSHVLIHHSRFLLPALHIKMVLGMPTISQRYEALQKLPPNLYESFRTITTRIRECLSPSQAELGMQVLMWLHFAYRPLKLVELQHALAVKKNHTELDAHNIPSQKALLDYCLGLVVVDDETLTVRFVHYTLEEYFCHNARTEFPDGSSSIAETCLTYLCFGKLRQYCTSLDSLRDEYAFLSYAAQYWGMYVKQQSNDYLTNLAKVIVDHESERPPCAIQALYSDLHSEWGWRPLSPIAQRFSGVHVTAYFGLVEIMAYFCKMGRRMKVDDFGRTPLSWAAEFGHESIVQMLLKRGGVDLNDKDSRWDTPLTLAAKQGHEAIVRLLVERDDVDKNVKDFHGITPLTWAAKNGHLAVVQLLIERDDVDIHVTENDGRTPLTWAARSGQLAVLQLLIGKGDVDINVRDSYGRTPLSNAAWEGQVAVVQLLIGRDDVDINLNDYSGATPLSFAAHFGHEAIMRLLVARDDVYMNIGDMYGETPLSKAAGEGYEVIVRLLIARDDVDINVQDDYGRTPLSKAAEKGHEAVVRLLAARDDVDISIPDRDGKTPLSWAAEKGHEAIVQFLNDQCDVRVRDLQGSEIAPASSVGDAAGVGVFFFFFCVITRLHFSVWRGPAKLGELRIRT